MWQQNIDGYDMKMYTRVIINQHCGHKLAENHELVVIYSRLMLSFLLIANEFGFLLN